MNAKKPLKEKIRNYEWKTDGRSLRMGVGCAWLGRHMDDSQRVREDVALLDACYEQGARYFDTSCDYSKSELLLGEWLKHAPRENLFLCTKGRYNYWEDNPLENLKRNFYESFERLHVDHIDMYLLHDADAYGVMEQEALPFLLERQKEGMIDYIGQGTRDVNAHQHAIAGGVMDGVLSYLQFCLIQTAAREAALEAEKAGVAFINGSPLAAGILIAPQEVLPIRNYTRTQADMRFAAEMRALLEKEGIDTVAAALQYPLLFDEIDMTLTGTSTAEELRSTLKGLHAVIYPEQWARIFRLQESYRFFRLQPEYAKNRK